MKNYDLFYAQLKNKIKHPEYVILLDKLCTGIMYAAYPILLLLNMNAELLRLLLVPASGFILVSLLRIWIKEPRPYQQWSIEPIIKKDTLYKSMPSRHVFSSVIIAMCYVYSYHFWGIIFLGISLLAAMVRIIGGVHYPKDVIAGYLLALAYGLLLFIH